jgi:hypothetical protein
MPEEICGKVMLRTGEGLLVREEDGRMVIETCATISFDSIYRSAVHSGSYIGKNWTTASPAF